MKKEIIHISQLLIIIFLLVSCNKPTTNSTYNNTASYKALSEEIDNKIIEDTITIFGVKAKREEIDLLNNLQQNGILTIDSLAINDSGFKYAIVEFAGVKFGMNKGFSFITSRKDKAAINNIVQKISEYYGEPWIENEDKEEPQYQYYRWNIPNPLKPSIRIRPLHSDEGGLVMFWEFPR